MQRTSKRAPRLYTNSPLKAGQPAPLSPRQNHYVLHVMRLSAGAMVRLFNGRDGEWLCRLEMAGKKHAIAICSEKLRDGQTLPDIDYLFAPLKSARLDYMAQKATELGARRLCPVITEFTQVGRVKTDRLVANAVEAAEQCNMVAVPGVCEPQKLARVLEEWDGARQLVFCDEAAAPGSPLAALEKLKDGPLAVLTGPEGGFSSHERKSLLDCPFVTPISLGPRIMRADTAGVSALTLLQAVKGDWPQPARQN